MLKGMIRVNWIYSLIWFNKVLDFACTILGTVKQSIQNVYTNRRGNTFLVIITNIPVGIYFSPMTVQVLYLSLVSYWEEMHVVQLGKDEGGLATPNPWLYFLAALLQHIRGWSTELSHGPLSRLFTVMNKGQALSPFLEAGFPNLEKKKV